MVEAYVHEYHSCALIPNQNIIIARNRVAITQYTFVVNEHIRSPTDRVHDGVYQWLEWPEMVWEVSKLAKRPGTTISGHSSHW